LFFGFAWAVPGLIPNPPLIRGGRSNSVSWSWSRHWWTPVNVLWEPFKFKVWRQEDHLVGQTWDSTPLGVTLDFYPESETNFFLKVNVDRGQLTFVKNEKGK
jgi:hypothetical protein